MHRTRRIGWVVVFSLLPLPLLAWFFTAESLVRDDFIVERYRHGQPVFADRGYVAEGSPTDMGELTVVRIPRHFPRRIELRVDVAPVTLVRFVCDSNDNHELAGWETLATPVKVVGETCTHTRAVRRTFDRGRLSLLPGGPTATNPILVRADPGSVDAWYPIELHSRFLPYGLDPRSKRVWLLALLLAAYYGGVGRLSVHRR